MAEMSFLVALVILAFVSGYAVRSLVSYNRRMNHLLYGP